MLALFILVPLVALVALNVPLGRASAAKAIVLTVAWSALQVALAAMQAFGVLPPNQWLQSTFAFGLAADPLSLMMLVVIGIITAVAAVVAGSTVSPDRRAFHFVNVLLVAMIGMNGLSLATDLFTLYVFIEVTSVASFILIAVDRTSQGLEGAFKYIILSAVASVLMVGSVAVLMMTGGSTGFAQLAAAIRSPQAASPFVLAACGAFICGLLIKGGLVPFHGWVVGAYAHGNTAASVLLAGIASKAAGVYTLMRLVVSVFGAGAATSQVLLLVGVVSAAVGALAALGQRDLKRLLAWSSISQVGYILLGLGCAASSVPHAAELGLLGAALHFFNHAMLKGQLFVNAAALQQRLGGTDMDRMGGLGERMPWTSLTAGIAALSTAGIPPLAGFWSKLIIIIALWQAGLAWYAAAAVAISVVTLGYMLTMQRKIFFGQLAEGLGDVREASPALVVPAVALAAISVGVGVTVPVVGLVVDVFQKIAAGILGHG